MAVTLGLAVGGLSIGSVAHADTTTPAPKALINGDTVSGGADSIEATMASSLGFDVTVVDGGSWDSMSQSDFGSYQVLIAGDPTCGVLAPSFYSNESTWAPVVMGQAVTSQAGNRVLIGTDPVFHDVYGGRSDTVVLIADGIAFAGANPGRTGLYLDTSCFVPTDQVPTILSPLSTGTGTWSADLSPPCGGNVAKIATTPQFDSLQTSNLEGWGCSVHETYPAFPSDWSALAIATDTSSHPVCGTDNTTDPPTDACGEPYVLIAGSGIVTTAPDITLTPATSTDPAGGSHTVTANVTSEGSPLAGQLVTFTVTGQNAGVTGTCDPADCTTDSSGNVTFTYTGSNGAGEDTIIASFISSGTKQQASATEDWTEVGTTHTVSVDTPTNGTITASGIDCGTTCSNNYDDGSAVTLTATPDTGYHFTAWTGDCASSTENTCTFDPITSSHTLGATFAIDSETVTVSVPTNGAITASGIDCGTNCIGTYDYGSSVTLTATPDTGYHFTAWTGDCASSTESTCTFDPITSSHTLGATFAIDSEQLSVTTDGGSGQGSVVSTPTGIDCGSTCSANFDYNTSVDLTPTADAGSHFTGWTGCDSVDEANVCTVSMTGGKSVTASFALDSETVTVTSPTNGTITASGIDCGTTCTNTYDYGTSVTLTATPDTGYHFTAWTGDCASSTESTCTFDPITSSRTLGATFAIDSEQLSVTTDGGSGQGSVVSTPTGIDCGSTCSANFDYNTSVDLTPTADAGSHFTGWTVCDSVDGSNVCTVAMTAAKSVQASFDLDDAPRPDAQIKLSSDANFTGDNQYLPTRQLVRTSAARLHSASFVLRFENDRLLDDSFTIDGHGNGPDGYKVLKYTVDGKDVSKQIVAGTYQTPTLKPGEFIDIQVKFTLTKRATRTYRAPTSAISNTDNTIEDTVIAAVKTKT